MLKPSFEEKIDIIDSAIKKRYYKWGIKAISWMDYDDVSQIIRIHIYEKWDQYNPEYPLEPWINKIITYQLINLSRNVYYSNARPCLKCPDNEGGDLCRTYKKQCDLCPLFAKWQSRKKPAYDIRLPLPMENHMAEVYDMPSNDYSFTDKSLKIFHSNMQKVLTKKEWRVYKLLYIDNFSENETAKKLGFKTSESSRQPGYARIKQIQKIIIAKANKLKDKIDFF